ncbi:MAG: RecX family transcriptional regulator [Candidatus Omnitrophota bacterium]|nr:MAG: RecX family transcriptional regulator [Candidatus Omnitrophota bacterium]
MEDFQKALNYSYLLLKYRPRSKQEIVFRLKKKKFSSSLIEKVISRLEEYNYINDSEFARLFASSCQTKGWGPKKILFALKRLGISSELVEQVLKDKSYREKMREMIEKKIVRYKGSKGVYQKLLRYLGKKGFDYQEIIQELDAMGVDRFEDR